MKSLVDDRHHLPLRPRKRHMTVEMVITDFEFTPGSTVESILEDLPGIERFSVESGSGQTSITFAPEEVSLATIVEAIGRAGYFTLIGCVSSN